MDAFDGLRLSSDSFMACSSLCETSGGVIFDAQWRFAPSLTNLFLVCDNQVHCQAPLGQWGLVFAKIDVFQSMTSGDGGDLHLHHHVAAFSGDNRFLLAHFRANKAVRKTPSEQRVSH